MLFFLSDSTTRPSDLPLYVIVESRNSHSVSLKSCFKWPRPFWGDLGRNENRPRPLCRCTMVVLWGIVVPHIAHASFCDTVDCCQQRSRARMRHNDRSVFNHGG